MIDPKPRSGEWLSRYGDSQEIIGGRATDLTVLSKSLEDRVKATFPINSVPEEIARKLKDVHKLCQDAEREIEVLIGLVDTTVLD